MSKKHAVSTRGGGASGKDSDTKNLSSSRPSDVDGSNGIRRDLELARRAAVAVLDGGLWNPQENRELVIMQVGVADMCHVLLTRTRLNSVYYQSGQDLAVLTCSILPLGGHNTEGWRLLLSLLGRIILLFIAKLERLANHQHVTTAYEAL